jgi:PAS domain S-box-containing protein
LPILINKSIMISLLYVDDEPALLDLCKIFLEKTGDFSVTTRGSAIDAAGILGAESFDAIICDYQMPEKDGIAFLQDVRINHPDIPFILFTGRGREEIAVRAFELGADFYLQKGGDPTAQFAELTQKIRQAIRRRKAEESARRREQQINAMAANIPGVVYRFYVNPDGSIGFDYISERSWQVLGIHNDPVTFFDHFVAGASPEDRERFLNSVRYAIDTKNPWEYEGWHLKPSGEKVWVRAISSPAYERGLLIFDGVIFDNTARKQTEDALIQSEAYYRALFKYTESATIIIEKDTTVSLANDAFAQLYGSPRDTIEGKIKWTHFVDPRDLEGMVDYHQRRRNNPLDVPTIYEFRFITSDGNIRDILAHVGMIPGTMQSVASLLDITERKQAQEELGRKNYELQATYEQIAATDEEIRGQFDMLTASERMIRDSEIKFRSIVESVPVGMHFYELEPDGRLVLSGANPAADAILRISHAPLCGKTIEVAFPYLAGTDIPDHYRAVARDAVHWHTEQVEYKDELISGAFSVWAFPTLPGAMVAAFYDITEIKRTEQRLQESVERYRSVVEDQTELISRFLPGETHIFVNEAYCRYFGMKREEIIGSRFRPHILPEDRERVAQLISSLNPEHPVGHIEQRILMPDGSIRW